MEKAKDYSEMYALIEEMHKGLRDTIETIEREGYKMTEYQLSNFLVLVKLVLSNSETLLIDMKQRDELIDQFTKKFLNSK